MTVRLPALILGLAVLAGCATNDLQDPPAPLGDFALGLNIVVADHMQKVPISRPATVEEWETSIKRAVDQRFARYGGAKLYNIGINVDAFALAPPGIPVVVSPKSVLVISANVWDDAAGRKLNAEPKQLTVFESFSGGSVIGSGLTRTKAEQMEGLSYNAVKAVERWFLENPAWFAIPPEAAAAAIANSPAPVTLQAPTAAAASQPVAAPVAAATPIAAARPSVPAPAAGALLPAGTDVPLVK